VSPVPRVVDDSKIEPVPVSSSVTSPSKMVLPEESCTSNQATVPAAVFASSVIAEAVATPEAAAPKAVAEKVNVASNEPPFEV